MDIQFADCEVYSNCFMLSCKHKESGFLNKFLIFADTKSNFVVNDLDKLVAFCNRPNELWLITYNGFLYDNQILNSIM